MNSIDTRIAALSAELERRKMEQEWPVDDLSRSLQEMGRELAGLDEQGKAELLQALNEDGLGLDRNAFEQFMADYKEAGN